MIELKVFRDLYRALYRMRAVELEIASRYSENLMRCPVHLSVGQEAISAAFSLLVRSSDYAVSGHRGHTHYLGKGGSLTRMIAELYGKSTGCCKGRGGSMHLADSGVNFLGTSAIVGNSIPVGVGVALAQKLQGRNSRVFVFLGDAATEEGVFYESISFAAIHNLSVIFICENNGFSVYSDFRERQPNGREIFEMANAMGVKSSKIDGMNPIESFEGLQTAISYVENNNSPFFLEVTNHRFLEHCGPNDDSNLGYRHSNYSDLAKENDPVVQLESYLRDAFVDDAFFAGIRKEIDLEIGKAFEFAMQSPLAEEELSEEDVFSK